jgi:protein-L-isoaspartate(D-aspartate) O-methyltransferase
MKGLTPMLLAMMLAAGPPGCRTQRIAGPGETGEKAVSPEFEERLLQLRLRMVREQLEARDVTDPGVLAAMRTVPRHRFVPPELIDAAYEDGPLPLMLGQTISQPYIVGYMTQALALTGKEHVLEIGTGSGYQAAVLAELAAEVYSIEILPELAALARRTLDALGYQKIHTRCGDGYIGWPEAAPFDCIIVTAAPDHIPEPLVDQLKVGGKMIIPVGRGDQELVLVEKAESGVSRRSTIPVRFVPMTGRADKKKLPIQED